MYDLLAKETITDKDIIDLLEESLSYAEEIKSRVTNLHNSVERAARENLDNWYTSYKNLSQKIGKGIALNPEEKTDLKELLLKIKQDIERGGTKGVSTGIDKYINHLE